CFQNKASFSSSLQRIVAATIPSLSTAQSVRSRAKNRASAMQPRQPKSTRRGSYFRTTSGLVARATSQRESRYTTSRPASAGSVVAVIARIFVSTPKGCAFVHRRHQALHAAIRAVSETLECSFRDDRSGERVRLPDRRND